MGSILFFCWNCMHGFVAAGVCVGTATTIDFGKQVGIRCCHLSEGFSVPLSLRTSPQTGVAIRSLKAGSPVFINRGSG